MTTIIMENAEVRVAEIGARIDNLPEWGVPLIAKIVFATAYFFAFYDVISIGASLPNIAGAFHLTGARIALPLTASLVGYIIGAILLGRLADLWGRRNTLIVTLMILAASSVLCALAWSVESLAFFRVLSGIGIGTLISLGATMINELSPSSQRARNIQLNIVAGGIGDALTPFIVIYLLGYGDIGWRLALGFGVLAIIPAILAFWLPESPRWLAVRGQYEKAAQLVAGMENNLRAKGRYITPFVAAPQIDISAEARLVRVTLLDLLRPPYLSRVLVVTTYWTLFYVAVYGFFGFETLLLNAMTITKPHGLLYTAIGDLAFPVGAALPLLLMGRIDRRYLLGLSSLVYMTGLIILATSYSGGPMVLGASLVAMMILFNAGVGYSYTTEIFPTSVRASAMGFADGGGHIGGVLAPYIIFAALSEWGPRGAFGFMAGLMAVCAVLIISLGVRHTDEIRSL